MSPNERVVTGPASLSSVLEGASQSSGWTGSGGSLGDLVCLGGLGGTLEVETGK